MESLIYIFSVLLCVFALSGINYTDFFKKDCIWEARTFIVIMSLAFGYLVASFLIKFMEVTKMF